MPRSEDAEVVIIGAGPVGLILARELALIGIRTTVYDGKNKVSDGASKASGIFSKKGLDRLGIDFSEARLNTLNGAIVHGGDESIVISAEDTKAYVLDRGKFAEILAREAVSAGATLELSKRVNKEYLIELAQDRHKIIVGADGAVSTVASCFGFPEIKEFVLTYKAEYEGVHVQDLNDVELFFNNKMAKRFFAWTVPYSKTKLEIGIGISSYSKKNSMAVYKDFIQSGDMQKRLGNSACKAGYASIIPLSTRTKTVKGNVLLVGDAAGQVKATTGGGVIFGSACAKVAAKCIAAHLREGASLESYEREWRGKYSRDLELHKLIHTYYSTLGKTGLRFTIRAAKALKLDTFLSRYGDMDSPYTMIKRLFLRGIIQ